MVQLAHMLWRVFRKLAYLYDEIKGTSFLVLVVKKSDAYYFLMLNYH